jgi:hypothetical protein
VVWTKGEKGELGSGDVCEEMEGGGGSGAGDAMRRKLEGRGTRPGGVWCWQGREVVGHLSRGPAGGRKELGRA